MKIKTKVVTVMTARFSDEEVNLLFALGRRCRTPQNSILHALVEEFGFDDGSKTSQILQNLADGFSPKSNA